MSNYEKGLPSMESAIKFELPPTHEIPTRFLKLTKGSRYYHHLLPEGLVAEVDEAIMTSRETDDGQGYVGIIVPSNGAVDVYFPKAGVTTFSPEEVKALRDKRILLQTENVSADGSYAQDEAAVLADLKRRAGMV